MLAFIGYDKQTFNEFFTSLQTVCHNDPLQDYISEDVSDHSDGWGFIDSDINFVNFSKYSDPIYKCEIPEMKGRFRLVHARNASKGQPSGFIKSHPYHGATTKYDIFLMHNGLVDKVKIKHNLSLGSIENMTDSEVMLDLMCTYVDATDELMLREALNEVYSRNALISGLNIFLFSINRKTMEHDLLIYSDALKFNEYHRFYYSKGKNWQCVYSSSILRSEHFPKTSENIPLDSRTIYRVGPEGPVALFHLE